MMDLLPAERAAELAAGPVTIDIDATDVEVYGSKKRGVAYNYQGQRAGGRTWPRGRRPRSRWPPTCCPGTRTLARMVGLLSRALAALPRAVRDGAAAAGREIALRADAGYHRRAGRAAHRHGISPRWRQADPDVEGAGLDPRDAWRNAIEWNAHGAVSPYRRRTGPGTRCCSSAGSSWTPAGLRRSRSRRRRTLHPDQQGMLFPELEQEPAIYAYSFICTNLDVSTPAKAAAAEHWYRHRTSIENIFRDSKHGATLRHLPSGDEQVNTAWMWASLIAAAIAAWLHQLTGLILGGELVQGHGTPAARP